MPATADPPTDLELLRLLVDEPCVSADEAARECGALLNSTLPLTLAGPPWPPGRPVRAEVA